jgi:hypothetical protein
MSGNTVSPLNISFSSTSASTFLLKLFDHIFYDQTDSSIRSKRTVGSLFNIFLIKITISRSLFKNADISYKL